MKKLRAVAGYWYEVSVQKGCARRKKCFFWPGWSHESCFGLAEDIDVLVLAILRQVWVFKGSSAALLVWSWRS